MTHLLKLGIVPDAHWPYADKRAWKVMLDGLAYLKPDILVCLGDLADFYTVSSHEKDPRRINRLEQELPSVLSALDDLDAIGAKEKHFLEGNHEWRLARLLSSQAPALAGLPHFSIKKLFELEERGWTHTPYKKHLRIGKLNLTHDVGHSGKYALHQTAAAFESNVVIGHTHRAGIVYGGNVKGESHVAASFGWLGSKAAADYMHSAKIDRDWSLGFGMGYMEPGGVVYLQVCPIVNYRTVVRGKLIR